MNLNTGQGVYSYKLPLPPGVAGYTPMLTLEYSHGARTEQFGLGWRLSTRSIKCRLDRGTPSDDTTETYLDGSNEIAQLNDGSFGAILETAFTRYTRVEEGWSIEERDGKTHLLGTTSQARIEHPTLTGRTIEWLLEKSSDPFGNEIHYHWGITDGIAYLLEILYAAYAIRFIYEGLTRCAVRGQSRFFAQAHQKMHSCRSLPGSWNKRTENSHMDILL